ncbi:MAG: hypothetical protein AAFN92_03035 [Bacteroidota bacterium]
MRDTALFRWIFYGHLWIAFGATGLSWLSLRLAFGRQEVVSETPVLAFIFFATLAVYTLHRYLSFRRARSLPTARRYDLIARHPKRSLAIGVGSLVLACGLGWPFVGSMWRLLLWAVPLTVFYLTPPLPGWPRLRDLPYLKVVWVGLAWSIMTVGIPEGIVSELINDSVPPAFCHLFLPGSLAPPYDAEVIVRFLFTGSVALLFDLRDQELDRSQGVKTVANDLPALHRILTFGCLTLCGLLTWHPCGWLYFALLPVASLTYGKRDEDWYAVVVNGFLLAPPLLYFLGAAAGAEVRF